MTSSSAEEYTKALRRRMISEVLQKSNHDIWQIQQLPNSTKSSQPRQVAATTQPKQLTSGLTGSKQTASSRMSRPSEVKRSSASSRIDQRRSQSAQGKRSSNGGPPGSSAASNVETSQSSNKNKAVVPNNCRPGLGRRSVTQLELSRRKRPDEDMAPLRQSKWHSQEHLDQVKTQFSLLVVLILFPLKLQLLLEFFLNFTKKVGNFSLSPNFEAVLLYDLSFYEKYLVGNFGSC